jgi:flagellar assembly protein FliH
LFWQVGVVMTFSSKVIKSSNMEPGHCSQVTFDKLTAHDNHGVEVEERDSFKALPLGTAGYESGNGAGSGVWRSVMSEQQSSESEPVPVMVHEEEAVRMAQVAYNDGLRDGKQQSEQALAKTSAALAKAVTTTGRLREKIFQESEDDLLRLSIMIAGKIIRKEIATDRDILRKLVQEAIGKVTESDEIIVRLNPDDLSHIADESQFLPPGGKRSIALKADETVPSGGCFVDTVMGSLDARVEAQLEEIFRRLMEERSALRVESERGEGEGNEPGAD